VLLERLKEIVPMFQTCVSDLESLTVPASSL
jgi:hypothetical protein